MLIFFQRLVSEHTCWNLIALNSHKSPAMCFLILWEKNCIILYMYVCICVYIIKVYHKEVVPFCKLLLPIWKWCPVFFKSAAVLPEGKWRTFQNIAPFFAGLLHNIPVEALIALNSHNSPALCFLILWEKNYICLSVCVYIQGIPERSGTLL